MSKTAKKYYTQTPLPDDLASLFANTRQATPADLTRLEKAAVALGKDPSFIADVTKSLIVEDILRAMDEAGLNRNTLATKLGKSRQYIGKILDEESPANFTIDTLAELATALNVTLQVRMGLEPENTIKEIPFAQRTQTVASENFYSQRQTRNFTRKQAYFQPSNVIQIHNYHYEKTSLSS